MLDNRRHYPRARKCGGPAEGVFPFPQVMVMDRRKAALNGPRGNQPEPGIGRGMIHDEGHSLAG